MKIVKLITGEELLAQVFALGKFYRIVDPKLVVDRGDIVLRPWLIGTDVSEVLLDEDHVLGTYAPNEAVLNAKQVL